MKGGDSLRLLIVDDEESAIRAVRHLLDWDKMGIDSVDTAQSMLQAQQLFLDRPVDLLLCDIEMPQGNGLQLLEWVREHYPQTECIFLTCHADFNFSKKAIRLGSMDYLLKPIYAEELEPVVRKAVEKVQAQTKLMDVNRTWSRQKPQFVEQFWREIRNRVIPSNLEAIRNAAQERGIPIRAATLLLPIWVQIREWSQTFTQREEKILEYALKNAAEELLQSPKYEVQCVSIGQGTVLILLSSANNQGINLDELRAMLEKYIESCNRYFYCSITCYAGNPVEPQDLAMMADHLEKFNKTNVTHENTVLFLGDRSSVETDLPLPDMRLWSTLLGEGKNELLFELISDFLTSMSKRPGMNADFLHRFRQDFLQMIYSVLTSKGIHAHQLFSNGSLLQESENSVRSVKDMIAWIGKVMEHLFEESTTVIDKIKRFILSNLDREISRDDIADHVFLNPDYLSRLVRKETGATISEYIQTERMALAKSLLEKSDLPIGQVAKKSGFHNFSHFSNTFRKHTGLTPNDYRSQSQKKSK